MGFSRSRLNGGTNSYSPSPASTNANLRDGLFNKKLEGFNKLSESDINDIVGAADGFMSDTNEVSYKYDTSIRYIKIGNNPVEEDKLVSKFNNLIIDILKKYANILFSDSNVKNDTNDTNDTNSSSLDAHFINKLRPFGSIVSAICYGIMILHTEYENVYLYKNDSTYSTYRNRLNAYLDRCREYVDKINALPFETYLNVPNKITDIANAVIKEVKGGKTKHRKTKHRKTKHRKTKHRKTKNRKTKRRK
jgi:uncharacterized spore protein YtfJ